MVTFFKIFNEEPKAYKFLFSNNKKKEIYMLFLFTIIIFMKIEIEKKYDLTNHDFDIIKDKCEFIEEKEIKDYYLDDSNFTLFKKDHRLRLRNGKYELKIKDQKINDTSTRSIEIDDEDKIEAELKKFNLSTDHVTWVLEVITHRSKYKYNYKQQEFIIDIDIYKYGSRYEVELCVNDDSEIDGWTLIDELRNELWLTGLQQINEWKISICAMYENINLYEILLDTK